LWSKKRVISSLTNCYPTDFYINFIFYIDSTLRDDFVLNPILRMVKTVSYFLYFLILTYQTYFWSQIIERFYCEVTIKRTSAAFHIYRNSCSISDSSTLKSFAWLGMYNIYSSSSLWFFYVVTCAILFQKYWEKKIWEYNTYLFALLFR